MNEGNRDHGLEGYTCHAMNYMFKSPMIMVLYNKGLRMDLL